MFEDEAVQRLDVQVPENRHYQQQSEALICHAS
jgi:hypothetical protein